MPGRRYEAAQLPYRSERRPHEQEQVEMPGTSLLNTKPPEASELTKLPLQAPTQGFQVVLADLRVLWIFVGVGQGYRDEPSLEGLECGSIDACKTSEEVCAACPGEAPYPVSGT